MQALPADLFLDRLAQPDALELRALFESQRAASIRAGSHVWQFVANPSAVGDYNTAHALNLAGFVGVCELSQVTARCEFPGAVGEQYLLTFWRYRRDPVSGAFSYTRATNDIVVDNNLLGYSYTIDVSSEIRSNIKFNVAIAPVGPFNIVPTDGLTITSKYTAGGSPTMKAYQVDAWFRETP